MIRWSDVTIAVPTMPQRRAMKTELVDRLQTECQDARIVVREHREGDPPRMDLPALSDVALAMNRQWVLFVEDDVWLCPGFSSLSLAAINHSESVDVDAVALFSRAKADVQMYHNGKRWRFQPPSSFCMMQAVAVWAVTLTGLSMWAPSWYRAYPQHEHAADLLLGAWLSFKGSRMLVHVPSLVQHRKVPSTLPNHRGVRQSETYRLAFGDVP
jgi:hypothetical protein